VGDLAADHVVLATLDLTPLDASALPLRGHVACEGVGGLVVVVVAVEGSVVEIGHGASSIQKYGS
jgi:hypothetical protein